MGVSAPQIESAVAARALVDACRFPPRGLRGTGRPLFTFGEPTEAFLKWADEDLVVSAQIETAAGVDALAEIVKVDGLDMIQSGRNDLALSLGFPGQPGHPKVLDTEERIVETARAAGKWVSLQFAPGPRSIDQARAWMQRGVECITIGGDVQILLDAIRRRVTAIRDGEEHKTDSIDAK
jgi:4-hydroxy-2-oxoheptanedioate aldolase